MKTLFKPYNLLLYLLTFLTFFLVGLYFCKIIGYADNQGLAGGAIVLGYGILFAFGAFITSIFLAYFTNRSLIILLNKILTTTLLCFLVYTAWQYSIRQKEKNPTNKIVIPRKITEPITE